ncbi:hypothetical protein [Halorubrum sp. DTA98]|uniref:COG1361 S-layer family protein n=1 Tax=Halorubrum sp. DTA98 TaxID=3402163 RepID=UPI003AABB303
MPSRTVLAVVAVLVVALTAAGLAAAQEGEYVSGEPDIDVYVPEPEVEPGTDAQLTLQIANDGSVRSGAVTQRDTVTTARAVSVEVTDAGPFDVSTRRQSIGSVPDGGVRDVPLGITVPDDVAPGEHSIDVRVRYSYTSMYAPGSSVVQERTRTVRTSVDVVVADGARFDVRTVESDVQVGDSGTLLAEVTNVGNEPARETTLELESTTSDVTLGDGPRNTARIDRLDPGENATVAFDASIRPSASVRNVTLAGTVRFTDRDGVATERDGLSVGLRPADEQAFSLTVNESTLRVGERGTIRGTVTNEGPAPVEDVVLSVGDARIELASPTYAVGDLAPDENASFRFRGVVPSEADPVPQRLDVTASYRTAADTDRSTTLPARVAVAERRDAVDVAPVGAAFAAGESGTLTLDVTNRRDDPITEVRVRIVVEEPLESEFRTTVVDGLAPGETDRVAFDLDVDDDAPESRFPAVVEIEYIDPDGDPATMRPSTVGVSVTDAADGDLPLTEVVVTVAVLLFVVAGGWWFYGRRFV